jgi:hypothetical protein
LVGYSVRVRNVPFSRSTTMRDWPDPCPDDPPDRRNRMSTVDGPTSRESTVQPGAADTDSTVMDVLVEERSTEPPGAVTVRRVAATDVIGVVGWGATVVAVAPLGVADPDPDDPVRGVVVGATVGVGADVGTVVSGAVAGAGVGVGVASGPGGTVTVVGGREVSVVVRSPVPATSRLCSRSPPRANTPATTTTIAAIETTAAFRA